MLRAGEREKMTTTTTLNLVIMFYPSDRVRRRQCPIGLKKSDRQNFNMSICKQTNAACMCYLTVVGVCVCTCVCVCRCRSIESNPVNMHRDKRTNESLCELVMEFDLGAFVFSSHTQHVSHFWRGEKERCQIIFYRSQPAAGKIDTVSIEIKAVRIRFPVPAVARRGFFVQSGSFPSRSQYTSGNVVVYVLAANTRRRRRKKGKREKDGERKRVLFYLFKQLLANTDYLFNHATGLTSVVRSSILKRRVQQTRSSRDSMFAFGHVDYLFSSLASL